MTFKAVKDNKVHFDYHLVETFEAGLVLIGSEPYFIRNGHFKLQGAWVEVMPSRAVIHGLPINNETRKIQLLLNPSELRKIESAVTRDGMTCVVTSLYLQKRHFKVGIAIAKGKTHGDKRQTIKDRDLKREMRR